MTPVRVRGWLAATFVAGLMAAMPLPTFVVESAYSRGLYPWIQRALTTLSNLVPIAVIDVMIAGAAIGVIWRVVLLVKSVRKAGVIATIWEGLRRLLRAASIAVILFFIAWGYNYRRAPVELSLSHPATQPTQEVLTAVANRAVDLAGQLRPIAMALPAVDLAGLARELEQPMEAALAELQRPPLKPVGRPKISRILSPYFGAAGVTAMVNPFALESIVLPDLLPYERPHVLAHEWAHLAGHADEAEASAVGWLACMKGGPSLAYSAVLDLVMDTTWRVRDAAARRALTARIDPGVRADIDAIYARVRRHQKPQVQQVAFKVYDGYLRANRVADGVASYGRALTLILSPSFRETLDTYKVPAAGAR